MGNGIAHVFARSGFTVILRDIDQRFLDRALDALTNRPDRFVRMHFMNPVPVMVLVEVIRALETSDATFQTTMQLAEKLEKKPVAVNDAPGFVSNRVLMPLINEAAYCVMEGVATPEAVDAVMKLGMNHPMGPL